MAAPLSVVAYRLLLVDDEPEILASLRRSLRGEGYELVTTTSPREALEVLAKGGIDLLLSDIDMPEMDGLELIARARRLQPHVARLLLTGDASLRSAVAAINEGEVHRYLLKPWDRKELCATIAQALARLDELRSVAIADRRAMVREKLRLELEHEHPGITSVTLENGAYVLDSPRVDALVRALEPRELRSLFTDEN
jgi:CheY-like chemotaxis protein